jgi:hypothetical protein
MTSAQFALGLLTAALALVGSIAHAQAPSAAPPADEKWLDETAGDMNRTLPKLIDPETRLDRVTAGPGKRLTYSYTLVNRESAKIDVEAFNAGMQPVLRTSVCGRPGMQALVKNGVTLVYSYRGSDGKFVSMIEVIPQHCG